MSDETQVLQHDEDAVEETPELDESDAANVAELELDVPPVPVEAALEAEDH